MEILLTNTMIVFQDIRVKVSYPRVKRFEKYVGQFYDKDHNPIEVYWEKSDTSWVATLIHNEREYPYAVFLGAFQEMMDNPHIILTWERFHTEINYLVVKLDGYFSKEFTNLLYDQIVEFVKKWLLEN